MRHRQFLFGVLASTLVTALAACAPSDVGPTGAEDRDVSGATAVTLAGVGRLTLSTGPTASLRITARENLLDDITSEVEGGVLVLDVRRTVTPALGTIEFDLVLPQVDAITVSGAGDVEATLGASDTLDVVLSGAGDVDAGGVDVETLEVTVSGAGSVTLAGRADRQDVVLSGVGSYDGVGLDSREADVLVSGTGSANVTVSGALVATVSGAGSITYGGGAGVESTVTGIGSIRARD